jgi:TolB protein
MPSRALIRWVPWALAMAAPLLAYAQPPAAPSSGTIGIFTGQSDVGSVTPPGTARYDPQRGVYTLTSAGANTWYHVDDFHYLWKQASGDLALTADIFFPSRAYPHDPDPHRKGILMFRQTLDPGGVYVGVGLHGSGMTALQYRRERGANTADIELNIDAPHTVRIEKRGDTFTLFLSREGEPPHQVGASVKLHLQQPFYIGLGAVSHDVNTTDRVEFSHLTLQPLPQAAPSANPVLYSTLLSIQTEDQYRRAMVIRSVAAHMQSPNWLPDGKNIYVYEDGRIVRIPLLTPPAGGAPQPVDTAELIGCSGNYGLSPDGKFLAVSCSDPKGGAHQVYVLTAAGGAARKVTPGSGAAGGASFFHAWSPDSRTIAFTRGSASRADIFTVPASGGPEHQLTSDTVNDGPDFSPDGKYIYFDSSRSGTLQIWRMRADGSGSEQLTDDDDFNSSPHVAPDGKSVAYLSQPAGSGPDIGDAALKLIVLNDGLIRTLAHFQGDRDSLSMYSWGDANHLAFVSYQKEP